MILRESILQCLEDHCAERDLIKTLEVMAVDHGDAAYSTILHVLTNLALDPAQAKRCWHEIIDHRQTMNGLMGREVSLRTAICDYFCSVQKFLKNPKVVEIKIFEETVKHSKYDTLTGLLNRKSFDDAMAREISQANRYGMDLSILFLDIDNFKEVNDTHGHPFGDTVLRIVADIVKSELRAEDIACRYGGEELVVIFPQIDREDAFVVADRIRTRVEETPLVNNNQTFFITVSGGLASFPADSNRADSLLACADSALYRAKGAGKNIISYSSADKRRYTRLGIDKKIKIKELGVNGTPVETWMGKDISLGGLLFESNKLLGIGTNIQLEVPLREHQLIFVIGRVVRVECLAPDRYDIGISISFQKMDKAAKYAISAFLRERVQPLPGNSLPPSGPEIH